MCVGLDPVPERLPDGVSLLEFCRGVVDATSEFACCYKPNLAFFERLGPDGLSILQTLVREIRGRDLPVIADAKRGDMGPTAEAYADALRGPIPS